MTWILFLTIFMRRILYLKYFCNVDIVSEVCLWCGYCIWNILWREYCICSVFMTWIMYLKYFYEVDKVSKVCFWSRYCILWRGYCIQRIFRGYFYDADLDLKHLYDIDNVSKAFVWFVLCLKFFFYNVNIAFKIFR